MMLAAKPIKKSWARAYKPGQGATPVWGGSSLCRFFSATTFPFAATSNGGARKVGIEAATGLGTGGGLTAIPKS